jgi:hypothetical protein
VAAHATGVITDAELLGTQEQVLHAWLRLRGVFDQVGSSYERYQTYLQPLKD